MTRAGHRSAGSAGRGAPAASFPELDAEWRRWIAENLLQGASRGQLVTVLAQQGCPLPLADREIALAEQSPYLQGAALLQARIAKRDWVLGLHGKLAAIDGGLDAVPRVERLPADDFFRDYYAAHRPVLIGGLIDHWPAMARWSLDHVEALLPGIEIQVQEGRETHPDYEAQSEALRVTRPLAEVLARLRRDEPSNDYYITANNGSVNRAALAPLWDEVGDIPFYLGPTGAEDGFFWMGPRGTITPFHHDLTNNLLISVRGRKKVTMVPSWETPKMRNHLHCYSRFTGPAEIAAVPDAERPAMLECVIGPGETLFLPVGWWHHVEGLDMTMGLSFTNFTRPNDFFSDYRSTGAM